MNKEKIFSEKNIFILLIVFALFYLAFFYAQAKNNPEKNYYPLQGNTHDKLVENALNYYKSVDIRALVISRPGTDIQFLGKKVFWNILGGNFDHTVSWIGPSEGFIAIDRNKDGIINDHSEIIGGANVSGFTEIATFDDNADSIIDERDAAYHMLVVLPGGVRPQRARMVHLSDFGIRSIPVRPQQILSTWEQEVKEKSLLDLSFYLEEKSNRIMSYAMGVGVNGGKFQLADVRLSFDRTNTKYNKGLERFDPRAVVLPNHRGYGSLMQLAAAVSWDNDINNPSSLISLLYKMGQLSMAELFLDGSGGYALSEKILYRWAKADTIDPSSRGGNMDARQITFMEALEGRPFFQLGYLPNPRPVSASKYKGAYDVSLKQLGARFMAQSQGKRLFTEGLRYNPYTDEFAGTYRLDPDAVQVLFNYSKTVKNPKAYWENVLRFVDAVYGLNKLTQQERDVFNYTISSSVSGQNLQSTINAIKID